MISITVTPYNNTLVSVVGAVAAASGEIQRRGSVLGGRDRLPRTGGA
jgi:hypothetical protein